MDPVSSAQFVTMKDSFARQGINLEAAYTPTGAIEYIYEVGRLLARSANVELLQTLMPGLDLADTDEQPGVSDLVRLNIGRVSIDEAEPGSMTVPEVLDLMDERIADNPGPVGGEPLVTPVHIVHITKACPAGEPEVPSGYPTHPWPPPNPARGRYGVTIGVCDNGLQQDAATAHPWMANVTGDPEVPGPTLPSGQQRIPKYAAHGTFGAGVAACMAPDARVYVNDHFTLSAAEREDVIIQKLDELIQNHSPDVVCLPAGTYTRNRWQSLGFSDFPLRHPKIPLVVSAGNDSTDREFWPAAFPWAVAVGALGTDQRHRAWFSNHGRWVDVYALGESIVNAYTTGEYTYQEPPKQPAQQTFYGMARWDGTSFSAPLVAGLIAAEMAASGRSAQAAKQAVLARAQVIPGVGPALFPPQTPPFP
jgi:subtilisin family serine protease